jgi:hypothetical protein
LEKVPVGPSSGSSARQLVVEIVRKAKFDPAAVVKNLEPADQKTEVRNGFTGEAERFPTYPSCMPATSS